MKIAVPYENGEICSHLAQVKEFLIFDVVDDEIISTKTVKQTYANDPGALVEFLKKENTAVLLCDALPIPMMIALRETSIQRMDINTSFAMCHFRNDAEYIGTG